MSNKYLSPTDYLLTNINEQILTITLNRPDALNALRPEMLDGIRNLITETENDKNISDNERKKRINKLREQYNYSSKKEYLDRC